MKLSKANTQIANTLQEQIAHFALIIARRKANCSSLPNFYKDKPVAWYEGALCQTSCILADILMEHNCYEGYIEKTVKCEQHNIEYTYEYFL